MREHRKAAAIAAASAIAMSCILAGSMEVRAEEAGTSLQESLQAEETKRIYEVRQDGLGDFVSIQEAVDNADTDDTLLIYPGIYEENVVIVDKALELIGTDRDSCIIRADSRNYHYVPLTIGAGRVYNMTICGESTDTRRGSRSSGIEGIDPDDPDAVYDWQSTYPGYAIHVDQSYGMGRSLSIENCRILSSGSYCIGAGCWPGQAITLTDCELLAQGSGGCLFVHNISYPYTADAAQFTMKDCTLKSYSSPYVLAVESEEEPTPLYLTFQNVEVSAVAYEDSAVYQESTWSSRDSLRYLSGEGSAGGSALEPVLGKGLLHYYSKQKSKELKSQLEQQGSLLEKWPQMAVGITYLWIEDTRKFQRELAFKEGAARYVLYTRNAGGGAADGWCGLSGIYLTDESSGNTLPEMNYTLPEMDYLRHMPGTRLGTPLQEPGAAAYAN